MLIPTVHYLFQSYAIFKGIEEVVHFCQNLDGGGAKLELIFSKQVKMAVKLKNEPFGTINLLYNVNIY